MLVSTSQLYTCHSSLVTTHPPGFSSRSAPRRGPRPSPAAVVDIAHFAAVRPVSVMLSPLGKFLLQGSQRLRCFRCAQPCGLSVQSPCSQRSQVPGSTLAAPDKKPHDFRSPVPVSSDSAQCALSVPLPCSCLTLYMHIYIYVHMSVCMSARMYLHTHVRTFVCM